MTGRAVCAVLGVLRPCSIVPGRPDCVPGRTKPLTGRPDCDIGLTTNGKSTDKPTLRLKGDSLFAIPI